MTKGTGEPLLGKKARGSLEAKRRPVKLGSQANLGQSHSPADASQCETPVQTAHWKPRTEWSLPPTSPEVKAPLPPAMPGMIDKHCLEGGSGGACSQSQGIVGQVLT